MRFRPLTPFALLGMLLCGCNLVLGVDDLVADRDDSAAGGSGANGGTGADQQGAGGQGAGGQSGGCAGVCGTAGCGTCPGSMVVEVAATAGTFVIDQYEVTNAEYAAFLATSPSLSLAPPLDCGWNDSFQPGAATDSAVEAGGEADPDPGCATFIASWGDPIDDPTRPVACVDWCDAAGYCAWAGKRLCGRFGGGAYEADPAGEHADASVSEWFAACTGPNDTGYPYGDTYEVGRCNDEESKPEPVEDPGFATCEGGFPGILHLSGNVAEWDSACTDYDNTDDQQNCLAHGGTWFQGEIELRCDHYRATRRYNMNDGIGFRCCADVE